MAHAPQPQAETADERISDRLDSWKEIAAYLKREVRTVQRWEKTEALPVHRHVHEKLGSVYAYKRELDGWWRERQRTIEAQPEPPGVDDEEHDEAKTTETPVATPVEDRHKRWLSAVLLILLAAVAGFVVRQQIQESNSAPPSGKAIVVVLPFNDLSSPQTTDADKYFAAGLTEEMTARLARVQPARLAVIALTPAYADTTPAQLRKQFRADYVLKGTVRRAGGRMAITAQLVQAKSRTDIWANSYERDVSDVLRIQNDVAAAIAKEVLTNLPPGTGTAAPAVDPEAYNNYLKGRYFWNKRSTDSLFKAIDYFQEAIAKDPAYAAAYAGVADSYNLLGSSGYAALRPKEAFPKAIAAAQKALEIDSNSAEAHVSLGYARMVYNWDLPAAQREFQRALELNPAYPTAHQFYAYYLIAAGRESEAIAEDQKAQELDPLSPVITSALGETYYFTRQFDRMVEEDRKAVELDATFGLGLFNLGRAYGRKGLHDQAITTYNQALSRAPDDPLLLAAVAYEHAVAGQREQASKIIAKLQTIANTRYVPALYVGAIYLALGDKPHAMEYLAQAYEERCDYFIYLRRDPMADPMRNDPAFVGLLQKTGLAQ